VTEGYRDLMVVETASIFFVVLDARMSFFGSPEAMA
jgi:hypothetical protein